ncbi:MAG: ABC transporter permease [Nitrospira sp.]|nr:ABC transporter permease [Nitrospira sp.]
MTEKQMIRTYEPSNKTFGLLGSMRMAWTEIFFSRHVIWHLFKRDFVAQFRQKIFGYLWIIIAPLLAIFPFVFLHRAGILNPGATTMPYPIYIVMGMGIWGFLTNAFTAVSGGLQSNQDLIMRTNIPKITFAITGMANILYGVLVHCLVVALFASILGITPSIWAFVYPLALLPVVLVGVGLGLMFSVIGTVARDITGIMVSFLNLLMFFSPVVYKPEFSNSVFKAIVDWNPMTYLVDVPRSLFILGEFPYPQRFVMAVLFSLVLMALGLHSFYLIKDKVAERL